MLHISQKSGLYIFVNAIHIMKGNLNGDTKQKTIRRQRCTMIVLQLH